MNKVKSFATISIYLFILLACSPPSDSTSNESPTITSLSAIPDTVEQNGIIELSCIAKDPDNDNLTYSWDAASGVINGTGNNVIWTPPNSIGTYSISCTVDDSNGGLDIETVNVNVISTNSIPTISNLIADPDTIYIGDSSTLTCSANDDDRDVLLYRWKVKDGAIIGSGNTVIWESPLSTGDFNITCIVDDDNGGKDSASVNITVLKDPIPTEGLIAYWPFNGNANDESENTNNGIVNGANLAEDRFGNKQSSYDFNGVDDFINIGNNVKPDFPVTISSWINLSTQKDVCIFRNDRYDNTGYRYGLSLVVLSNGTLYSLVFSGYSVGSTRIGKTSTNSVITENEWGHYLVVFNNYNDIQLFWNGTEIDGNYSGSGNSLVYSNEAGGIGKSSINQLAIDGMIDDIRVYNRALTSTEIQALYNENGWGSNKY